MPVAPPPVVTTKSISRYCQMSSGGQKSSTAENRYTIFSILQKPRKFIAEKSVKKNQVEIKMMYLKYWYTTDAAIHISIFLCAHSVNSLFLYNIPKLNESPPHIFYVHISLSLHRPHSATKSKDRGGRWRRFTTKLPSPHLCQTLLTQ